MSDFPEKPEVFSIPQLPDTATTPPAGLEASQPTGTAVPETLPIVPRDPVWTAWDLILLAAVSILTLLVTMLAVLLAAKYWLYRGADLNDLARNALIVVGGQSLGYVFVFAYMYGLVKIVRRARSFRDAVHWNFPANPALYLGAGVVLSIGLQLLAHLLPIPKNLPIDTFFRTPKEAWVLTIFGVIVAPLMEELLFRGFLYPVLKRHLGMGAAVLLTAFAFALLHGSQLRFSWGPLLIILIVGLVFTIVRAQKNSVAASLLMHFSYNLTLSALMYVGSDGFRHLEKIRQ